MGDTKDNTLCIANDEDVCYTDDITCKKDNCNIIIPEGEIPYDGPNPQVEVDVPENEVEFVEEYSFAYWFRFHYRIPSYLPINIARNNFLAQAGVTENDEWTDNSECGDRALAVYYVAHYKQTEPTYRFSTYSDNGVDGCNPYAYKQIGLPFDTFEGEWFHIYFGYSYTLNQAVAHIQDAAGTKYSVIIDSVVHY